MKYKNYYTALFPALIDRQGYYDMQKEMNFKSVENTILNRFAGKSSFLAVVLPEDLNNTSNIPFNTEKSLRVRPLDIHDFIIPEPCSGCNQEEIKKIIAMHPVAYPDNTVPQGGSEEKADSGLFAGQVVECFFAQAGPDDAGSLRGLRYRLKAQTTIARVNLSCIGGQNSKPSDNFKGGGAQPNLGSPDLTPAKGAISKGVEGVLDWKTLKEIGKTGIFNPILDHIALHESGGNYSIYNLGNCGVPCYFKGDEVIKTLYGAKLDELSIATVLQKVQKNKNISGRAVFASGKYQITPSTLEKAIEQIPGCDTNELYGKEQQDAFGLYLVFFRKKTLGRYLLGENVKVENAQLSLAQEWASVHILEPVLRKGSKKQKVPGWSYRPDVQLKKYQAYYANYQLYKWNKTTKTWDVQSDSNPDAANETRALKTKSVLEEQRRSFLASPRANEIKKKFGLK